MGVDLDDVRSVLGTIVFGEAGDSSLLQLLDPLNFPLQTIADVDCEPWIFGVEDVSFGASFEGVGVSFDEVFKSGDSGVELQDFGGVVGLSLFDCFK